MQGETARRLWRRHCWMLVLAACCLAFVSFADARPASAMTFLVLGEYCPRGECVGVSYLKGTTSSESLQYLEFPDSASDLALSSDGNYIAWTSPGRGLYLSDSEVRSTTALVHYTGGGELGMHWTYAEAVFAPDQDVVFFNWDADCLEEWCEPFVRTPAEELHTASTAGLGDPIALNRSPGEVREPAISSDGGRLAFVLLRPEGQFITISDTSGQGETRVTTAAMELTSLASPSFAPEGNRLTFQATPRGGEPQIYTININGSELVQLTRSGGMMPQWSPDGSYVAYTSRDQRSIERIDPETGRALSPLRSSPPEAEELIYRVILPQTDALDSVRKFEPVLRFDSSEQWRPLNVDEFLAENQHHLCDSEGCDRAAITEALDLEHHATTESYINIAGEFGAGSSSYHSPNEACLVEELLDCDTGSSSAIYYRITRPYFEGGTGYRYIDYWFFYRLNTFSGEIDFHEGDWEGVTIAPSPSHPETFDYAAFSQHGRYYSYLRDVLRCEDTNTGSEIPAAGTCGRETERYGQRVAVMVAHGDHANYTTPCEEAIIFECRQNGPFIYERGYDGRRQWGNAFGDRYRTLLPLPPSANGHEPGEGASPESWAAGPHGWADWPGRWGEPDEAPRADGPQSPLNQTYSVVCAHLDNPEELCSPGPRTASVRRRRSRQPLSPGLVGLSCSSWIGTSVAAALCNQPALRAAIRTGHLRGVPTTRLGIGGRHARAVAAPGITQLAGAPLHDGSHVRLVGTPRLGTTLLLRIRGRGRYSRHIYIARFVHVQGTTRRAHAASAATLTLHVGPGRPTPTRATLGDSRAASVTPAR